jgi:hypothetical protein
MTSRHGKLLKAAAIRFGQEHAAAGRTDGQSEAWRIAHEEMRAAGVDTTGGSFDFHFGEFSRQYRRSLKGLTGQPKTVADKLTELDRVEVRQWSPNDEDADRVLFGDV